MSTRLIIDVVGWVGAVSLLVAYGLVSARRLEGDAMAFQHLNVLGAICLIINSAYYGAFPSAFVNVVWIGIAITTIVHVKRKSP